MEIDSRTFRHTVGQFVTGVTVIALEVDGTIRAMTANSFTSLSLEPPLVLFCVGKHTRAGQAVHAATGFSINILSEGQQDVSTYFAGAWKSGPPPAFAFLEWDGGPRLEGAIASLGCEIHAIHEGGDHWIVIGHVIATFRAEEERRQGAPGDRAAPRPLMFFRGAYATLGEERALLAPMPSFEGIGW
jgi:3-hydroxy-9,10-secoandrosta-1,3,5(10)-triene-9,17-dione monooxygenase reductase component